MIVTFVFASQFCGGVQENKAELPNDITDEEIINLFPKVMGFPYNNECYFIREDEDKSV